MNKHSYTLMSIIAILSIGIGTLAQIQGFPEFSLHTVHWTTNKDFNVFISSAIITVSITYLMWFYGDTMPSSAKKYLHILLQLVFVCLWAYKLIIRQDPGAYWIAPLIIAIFFGWIQQAFSSFENRPARVLMYFIQSCVLTVAGYQYAFIARTYYATGELKGEAALETTLVVTITALCLIAIQEALVKDKAIPKKNKAKAKAKPEMVAAEG